MKGLCGRCLSEFIEWRYSQSCWYFRPSFVNCCPSPLLSGSTLPSSPLFCVNKYTVYKYTVCKGRGEGMGFWASGRQTPAAKSLYRSIFLRVPYTMFLFEYSLSSLTPCAGLGKLPLKVHERGGRISNRHKIARHISLNRRLLRRGDFLNVDGAHL